MAESNSPAFVPPMNTVKDNDPMIVRVPLDKVDFASRKSAQPPMQTENMTLSHVPNGR